MVGYTGRPTLAMPDNLNIQMRLPLIFWLGSRSDIYTFLLDITLKNGCVLQALQICLAD